MGKDLTERRETSRNLRGSLTVEAAFVLPITFYALFLFLYLFLVMQVQLEVVQRTNEYVAKLQRYGGVYEQLRNRADTDAEESLVSELGFDTLFGMVTDSVFLSIRFGALMKDSPYLSLIRNGSDGFDCSGSCLFSDEGMITVQVKYAIKMPFSLWGIGDRKVSYRVKAKAFSGADTVDRANAETEKEEETTVYVTDNGEVYHTDRRCTYLKVGLRRVLRSGLDKERSKDGSVYYPCEECEKSGTVYVYLCSWGIRYHADPECRCIYHNITAISLTEANERGLRACSKCSAAGK